MDRAPRLQDFPSRPRRTGPPARSCAQGVLSGRSRRARHHVGADAGRDVRSFRDLRFADHGSSIWPRPSPRSAPSRPRGRRSRRHCPLDLTPLGFHAMVLSASGPCSSTLPPRGTRGTSSPTSRRDARRAGRAFRCGVTDERRQRGGGWLAGARDWRGHAAGRAAGRLGRPSSAPTAGAGRHRRVLDRGLRAEPGGRRPAP